MFFFFLGIVCLQLHTLSTAGLDLFFYCIRVRYLQENGMATIWTVKAHNGKRIEISLILLIHGPGFRMDMISPLLILRLLRGDIFMPLSFSLFGFTVHITFALPFVFVIVLNYAQQRKKIEFSTFKCSNEELFSVPFMNWFNRFL